MPQSDNDSGLVPDDAAPTTAPDGSQGMNTPGTDWANESFGTASGDGDVRTGSDAQWTDVDGNTGSWSTTMHSGPSGLQLISFWEWASWDHLTAPTSTTEDNPAYAGVTED